MSEPRQPQFRRLADLLTQGIDAGDPPPGGALPGERTLAATHGVSRITVRRALEELRGRGLVERRRGAGTFVSRRVSQPLSVLTSFSEDVAARGMTAQSRLISRGSGRASPEEIMGLGLTPGHPVTRITRLRSADGLPLAIESAAIPAEVLPDPALVGDSLYATLALRDLRPVRAVQRLTAIALDPRLAELLEAAPGDPALLITRIGYTAGDRAVEYTRSTFRGDRWDFVTELT